MENTLLAWSVKSNTIYVGMPSINSISKTKVCFLISVSTPTPIGTWYEPNLLEVNHPQTHMQYIFSIWVNMVD